MEKQIEEIGEVIYENDTLVITDPGYLISEDLWDNMIHYDNSEITQAFRQMGYTRPVLSGDTGFGDWSNEITDTNTGESYGHFSADAGMFAVVALSDVLRNNKAGYSTVEHIKNAGMAIVENFTGTVKAYFETYEFYNRFTGKTSEACWAVIKGTGNVNFTSNQRELF